MEEQKQQQEQIQQQQQQQQKEQIKNEEAKEKEAVFQIPEIYKSKFQFVQPTKQIIQPEDLDYFKTSTTYMEYVEFIAGMQNSVNSKPISATPKSAKFQKLISYLKKLSEISDQVEPIQQKMRFGNTAYKIWHEKAMKATDEFLKDLLPQEIQGSAIELKTYLSDSYGSNIRIDYGTGHEMAFAYFLLSLKKLGYFGPQDYENIVRNVFYQYIATMRKIQLRYMLEPAGSRGVYGLDDYHFLPFLFGAAELINHSQVKLPSMIHNNNLVEQYRSDYMYLECIHFINSVKTGSISVHSPTLNDISGAASWTKVAAGMIKMYQAEVLQKLPVAKHIFFGNILPYK